MTKLRMSLDDYGRAIEAAYIEGYVNGAYHPKDERIVVKSRELARLFWRTVEARVLKARRARRRVLPSGL